MAFTINRKGKKVQTGGFQADLIVAEIRHRQLYANQKLNKGDLREYHLATKDLRLARKLSNL